MNHLLKTAFVLILGMLITYLTFSYMLLNCDMFSWGEVDRSKVIFVWMCCLLISVLFYILEKPKPKQKTYTIEEVIVLILKSNFLSIDKKKEFEEWFESETKRNDYE